MKQPIELRPAQWSLDRDLLQQVRREVFITEQHVPEELEWDEHDEASFHVLALVNGQAVATGRIKTDGHIGRMAVTKDFRLQGIGRRVLATLLDHAARVLACDQVYLHAQESAIPFYEKYGFEVCSDVFLDAGIPHRTMTRPVDRRRQEY